MAFRIHDSVVRGEIDNRERSIVRGRIWVHGRAEPVLLELKGNAHPDLAGCLLNFTNPLKIIPHPGLDSLHPLQRGTIGDLTASRKVRVPDVPIEEFIRWPKEKGPRPEHMANCLYLEWFSEANGRVVIESADYQLDISPPLWRLTPEDEAQRAEDAAAGFAGFMRNLNEAVEDARFQAPEDKPMDEFEWEKAFRESDAITDKVLELEEKYGDDPDFEKILAREMGWDKTKGDDADDPEGKGFDVDEINRICAEADASLPDPNPLTEGTDWVRDPDGAICHPLEKRIRGISLELWRWCDTHSLLGEKSDTDLHDMIFQFQCCGAKCAAALGGLAYDNEMHEPGFIVAGLKRALAQLNESLEAAGRVESKQLIPLEMLVSFRRDLFAVREDILALMRRFRSGTT